jgi:hypothetical protein
MLLIAISARVVLGGEAESIERILPSIKKRGAFLY